jgi:hypothetical protein
MPVELHVIKASEFIRVGANEYLDFEASKKTLQSLAMACRKRGLNCAVLDLRTLPVISRPHFTKPELAALVMSFREAGFTRDQRLAVLYRHDEHGGIRDFAFIGRLRGLQVRTFQEFEAAAQWISEGQPTLAECAEPGVPVPISKPERRLRVTHGGRTTGGTGTARSALTMKSLRHRR